MTSNRRWHAQPLRVKYWSQGTVNSLTRQVHDSFSQLPHPSRNSVLNISVYRSPTSCWFMWKCHHGSAFERITVWVTLMCFLPLLLPHLVLLSSCLHHYPPPWFPSKGRASTFEKHLDFLKSQASLPRCSQLSSGLLTYLLSKRIYSEALLYAYSTNLRDIAWRFNL